MSYDFEGVLRRLDVSVGTLNSLETYWVGKQEFLASHGYTLRPRYRPGWIPSWRTDPRISVIDADDSHSVPVKSIALCRGGQQAHPVLASSRAPYGRDTAL